MDAAVIIVIVILVGILGAIFDSGDDDTDAAR